MLFRSSPAVTGERPEDKSHTIAQAGDARGGVPHGAGGGGDLGQTVAMLGDLGGEVVRPGTLDRNAVRHRHPPRRAPQHTALRAGAMRQPQGGQRQCDRIPALTLAGATTALFCSK